MAITDYYFKTTECADIAELRNVLRNLMFWVAALKILQNLWENLSNQFFLPFFQALVAFFPSVSGSCSFFRSVSGFLSIILGEKVVSRKNEA